MTCPKCGRQGLIDINILCPECAELHEDETRYSYDEMTNEVTCGFCQTVTPLDSPKTWIDDEHPFMWRCPDCGHVFDMEL